MSAPLLVYPNEGIIHELDSTVWRKIESDFTLAVDLYMTGALKLEPAELVEFAESYVHNAPHNSSTDLRQRVLSLICIHPQLFRSPSPEFIYQLLTTYGSNNVSAVVEFIEKRSNISLLVKKLAKVLIHNTSIDINQVEKNLSVLLTSPKISKLLATDKYWIEQSKKHVTLDILIRRAISVAQIKEMFSDIPLLRITQLLDQFVAVQDVIAHLLEHPEEISGSQSGSASKPVISSKQVQNQSPKIKYDAPELDPSKKFIRTDDFPAPPESSVEHTLRLVEIQMEEEEEDEIEEAARSADPASAKALDKVERHLWQTYQKNPDLFTTKQRKSRARTELKHATNWSDEQLEGWAKILERNPRRKHIMETRFMMRSHKASAHFADGLSSDEESERDENEKDYKDKKLKSEASSSAGGSNLSSAAGSGTTTPKHTPHNKKKNHHRKDRHDKKMQRMGAGAS